MIKTVIKCPENIVMVFDEAGEQIPEYQGQYEVMKESILKDAPRQAIFGYLCDHEPELRRVSREDW